MRRFEMGRAMKHPSEIGLWGLSSFGSYDIKELYVANEAQVYYLSIPKSYFCNMLVRLAAAGFALSFCSFKYVILFLMPFYVIYWYKISIFSKWCLTINYSAKKIKVFLFIILAVSELLCIILREVIKSLIYS